MRESVEHRAAKAKLARWIRSAARKGNWGLTPSARVFAEWPICEWQLTGERLWWRVDWWGKPRPPSFRALRRARSAPEVILDLAVIQDDKIHVGFEVVNWHFCSAAKVIFLSRLDFEICEIDSGWIMAQNSPPPSWHVMNRYGRD